MTRSYRLAALVLALALPLTTSGCASSIAQWIVAERNHQGDVSLAHRNFPDASTAYQLALKIDPRNAHARGGLVTVQLRLAQAYFAASKFDEAIDALALATKYSPGDDRIQSMRGHVEQAEIQRDIVVSNYPSYNVTGRSIRRAYAQLRTQLQEVSADLQRFDYTYDSADLSAAIRTSTALNEDLARLTDRLVRYRQLVERGVPERAAQRGAASPGGLLPLP